jgi:glycosyltransferase involved in cell wall biosynthesis
MRRILYITYDGLTDSLGQSQILAYLKRLSKEGNKITILSYEKEALFKRDGSKIKEMIDQNDLLWVPLKYTRKPAVLSTVLDIRKGIRTCKALHKQHGFQIVHCRGYISAIIGRTLQRSFGLKFLFDMRGWWPDEKLESGSWDKGLYKPIYRYFKKLEKGFLSHCDYSVSLTYKGRRYIEKRFLTAPDKIGVIPTCVDFEIFKEGSEQVKRQMREQLGIKEDEKVFVYSGSLGGNYDPDILVAVFRAYQNIYSRSFLLILSKDPFSDELRQHFINAGIVRMAIYNVPFTDVSNYLRASDVGFIYYKISFSVIGRSPTKMGEYWASGIQVIAFQGIGDLDYIVEKYPGGGLLLSAQNEHWEEQIKNWKAADAITLRNYAFDYFHVDRGVQFYQRVYEQLTPLKSNSDQLALRSTSDQGEK